MSCMVGFDLALAERGALPRPANCSTSTACTVARHLPLVRHGVVNRCRRRAVANLRTLIAPVSGSTSTSAT